MKRTTVSKCGSSVDEVIHSPFSSPQLTHKTHKTQQIGESVDIAGSAACGHNTIDCILRLFSIWNIGGAVESGIRISQFLMTIER